MIIISRLFLRLFTNNFARAMALYPFILIKDASLKNNTFLLNHERIHLRQQLELLIIPFYLWYLIEFSLKFFYYRSFMVAYQNLCFEREAFHFEDDLNYLSNRKIWSFWKYI